MSETGTPRQNREGHPCPPWCETDHDKAHGAAGLFMFHGGATAGIEVRGKAASGLRDRIYACPFSAGQPGYEPVVSVASIRYGAVGADPQVWLSARDAGELAGLVEMLATATPAQHRELAAAIRRAAAQITEASDG
jgi:hypothetical protein